MYWSNLSVAQNKRLHAVLQTRSNTIILFHHSNCGVHRNDGDQEVREDLYTETYQSPVLPQRIRIPQALTREHQATSLAIKSTKKLVVMIQTSELHWIAPFNSPKARSLPQRSNPKVDSSVREASKSRSVESRPEAKSRVQPHSASNRRT